MTAQHTRDLTVPTDLRDAYARCRRLTRRHGTTYYWATLALPPARRPHVFALYGFCRHADDIVDALDGTSVENREQALRTLSEELWDGLHGCGAQKAPAHPVVRAVVHTALTFDIDPHSFERFLRSMAMDLTTTTYGSWDALCDYMDGSAAVIGEMMLPILEPRDNGAIGPARDLGLAFQLTNFLRDVGEDLDRGRVYLPQEDLARFGARPQTRIADDAWRSLMRFEIIRARELYRSAERGIAVLPSWSRPSIQAAHRLYSRILDAIEANDYDVFMRRARVSTAAKVSTAAEMLVRRR